jgi:hypothetical protein
LPGKVEPKPFQHEGSGCDGELPSPPNELRRTIVWLGKYELIINLTTAKALGLTIPETLLATADEVIQ